MSFIKLYAGLGNPGYKYENTRHNFGFMALDAIAQAKRLEFKNWSNMADISFYETGKGKVWLIKPATFMNNSGVPLSAFAKYYKIKPEEIFVYYDDFSIPLGEYRVRLSGSAGGHNGISSMITHLNTDKFPRMKLGIGPLPKFLSTPDFVLSKFRDEESDDIKNILYKSAEFFDEINENGLNKAVSKLSNTK